MASTWGRKNGRARSYADPHGHDILECDVGRRAPGAGWRGVCHQCQWGPSQNAGKQCNPHFFSASVQNDTSSEAMGLYMNKKGIEDAYHRLRLDDQSAPADPRWGNEGSCTLISVEIWARLRDLRKTGLSILVIDKEVEALTRFADQHFVIENCVVAWRGTSTELVAKPKVTAQYLSFYL